MNVRITPGMPGGEIDAIISKSDLHRVLICAAFSHKDSILTYKTGIYKDELSMDIKATMSCLVNMGAGFDFTDGSLTVTPINRNSIPDGYTLDCGESGSTLRFLLPLCSTLGKTFYVKGGGRLPERPIGEVINQLREHGCVVENDTLPLKVSGILKPGNFMLPGNISSQFISGFLFALPLLDNDSLIQLTTELESRQYVDMTVGKLWEFGIAIGQNGRKYEVEGHQTYLSPIQDEIEGDWSNSAFWLSAGALSDKGIACSNLAMDSLQPDSKIYSLLKEIGAEIHETQSGLFVRRNTLNSMTFDASQCPDLVPVLAVILSVCRGRSLITNAGRLRIKESDRLKTTCHNLKALGAVVEEKKDGLVINGVEKLKGGTVDSYNDHRIVMAMAIASIISEQEITITGSDAVNKSYKHFFDDFKKLGGKANVI